jgi:CheY-like chemotaxis protein
LLSNAVKYTPENGLLGLEVKGDETNRLVSFSVWDNGIGIKPEDIQRLFKPFVQLDSSLARQQAGTGLGLVLVKDLVELHGGTISVTSTFGEGSRFTVTLPWNDRFHKILKETGSVDPGTDGSPILAMKITNNIPAQIMLVDDDEFNTNILLDVLLSRNFKVTAVGNGIEFLEQVSRVSPDLILMDIQMPGMDGLEAIRRLRKSPDALLAAVPVIAVTALSMVGDREKIMTAGATEYLSKPYRMQELIELINGLLSKKP